MGLFMTMFLVSIVSIYITYLFFYHKYKGDRNKMDSINDKLFLVFIFSSSLFVVAILTNDPLFQPIGIPKDYEWLVGVAVMGFTTWRIYLNPLKDKVITIDKKVLTLEYDVSHLKSDVAVLKSDVSSLRTDVSIMKSDVGFIRERMLMKG